MILMVLRGVPRIFWVCVGGMLGGKFGKGGQGPLRPPPPVYTPGTPLSTCRILCTIIFIILNVIPKLSAQTTGSLGNRKYGMCPPPNFMLFKYVKQLLNHFNCSNNDQLHDIYPITWWGSGKCHDTGNMQPSQDWHKKVPWRRRYRGVSARSCTKDTRPHLKISSRQVMGESHAHRHEGLGSTLRLIRAAGRKEAQNKEAEKNSSICQ